MRKLAHSSILLLALLAVSGAGTVTAHSEIYRCIGEDDVPIYTDRICSALGALDHHAQADEPVAPVLPSLAQGCAHQIEMLQTRVRTALESGDVNDLAGLYHWLDATTHTADRVMPGLQVLTGRRLVNIEMESVELNGVDHPVRLWLDQYDPERPAKTVRTGFNLVMNSGCWWLHS